MSSVLCFRSSDFEEDDEEEEEEEHVDEDAADSLDEILNEDQLPGRRDGAADSNSMLAASLSEPMQPPLVAQHQADARRQRNLEEALLLQMDMQKRLHEQLEVGAWA